jgi:lipoprotein-anchoring transpeptidase ErfK/SrfK
VWRAITTIVESNSKIVPTRMDLRDSTPTSIYRARMGCIWLLLVFCAGVALVSADVYAAKRTAERNPQPLAARSTIALQVSLDRLRFSPGPIDGNLGANTRKALTAFQRAHALPETSHPEKAVWDQLGEAAAEPVLMEYTIAPNDVAGPFEPTIPPTLEGKARLDRLSYTGPDELLAEKFHMDKALLKRLNPDKRFDQAGTTIRVASVDRPEPAKAARVLVDKKIGGVFVFDRQNSIIAFYPATIGSSETPSPSGSAKVTKVVHNPTYTYDPAKLHFKEVKTREKLEIKPGPNNPVGLVWIELDKPGYGIHGSPQPSAISHQRSHGCVRLTNWDVMDLANLVSKGLSVEFTV